MGDVCGTIDRIAALERANYAAMCATARVTPGLDVTLRADFIVTTSEILPFADANHACLLQATPQSADDLIDEIAGCFQAKGRPTNVYISPACTPPDLAGHLYKRGFARQKGQEAWMVLDRLAEFVLPLPSPKVTVRQIDRDETMAVAEIFMAAFGLPVDFAPYMVQLLAPSVGLPGVHHYIALDNGQPVGTCSLLSYRTYGILGSAGVLPSHRGRGVATSLAVTAARDARGQGVDTLILQTTADTRLERLLRISGFKRAFTRVCYTLS